MAEIKLIRADFRLIHGQVITKWLKQTGANKILIIDDELSKDVFMAEIYTMSAPPGIDVIIKSVDEAVQSYKEENLGEGKLFVLFKNVPTIYDAYQKGFPFTELQIGGLGAEPGRKVVYGPITFNKSDADKLTEMEQNGVKVYLHQVPQEPSILLKDALAKVTLD